MNYENLQNESKFRKFLLGEMEENERAEFEGEFILDEELFEGLRVAEDELTEQYVRETLSDSEKIKFEENFLTTEMRRERVEFTRQMLAELKLKKEAVAEVKKTASVAEKSSFLESVLAFFKQPGIAFGSAFAVLLLVLGGWFLLKNSGQPIEVAKNTPTPTPQISVSPTPPAINNTNIKPIKTIPDKNSESTNQRPKTEPTPSKTPANANSEKPVQTPSSPVITTLALFAGGVRSDGKTNQLNLTKETTAANLQLNLESRDYKVYRVEIVDQNGKIVYQVGKLSAKGSKINTFIPAKNLPSGDYIIKLYGKNVKNEEESVADYQFRVNQK